MLSLPLAPPCVHRSSWFENNFPPRFFDMRDRSPLFTFMSMLLYEVMHHENVAHPRTTAPRKGTLLSAERLELFTDALVAIIATVMAIPLATLEEDEAENPVADILLDKSKQIGFFVVAFNLVMSSWRQHGRVFKHLEEVNFSMMVCNLMFLLTLSFYPIIYVFMMEFVESLSAVLFSLGVYTLSTLAFFAIRFQARPSESASPQSQLAWKFVKMSNACSAAGGVLAMILAPIISYTIHQDSDVAPNIYLAWLSVLIPEAMACFLNNRTRNRNKALFAVRFRRKGQRNTSYMSVSTFISRYLYGYVERGRIEGISDGVFAIAMTFQFLEIKVKTGPEVTFHQAVLAARNELLSYLISFTVLGMIWLSHYNIVSTWNIVPNALHWINTQVLLSVALLPFLFAIFVDKWDNGDAQAVAGGGVTLVGILLLIMWGVGLYMDNSARSQGQKPVLIRSNHYEQRKKFMLARLLVVPVLALVTAIEGVHPEGLLKLYLLASAPVLYILISAWEYRMLGVAETEQHLSPSETDRDTLSEDESNSTSDDALSEVNSVATSSVGSLPLQQPDHTESTPLLPTSNTSS
eukprot:m.198133 g.198133  ORF g.198133 m.198133 type:complete len:578 (-) comp14914_c0_seq4:5878-7611(-)